MSSEEFQAPQWVRDESDPSIEKVEQPISKKQKYALLATLFTVIPFCLWAGWFEFGRAQEGHWRAWVYAFEWPFFGAVAIYMYRRIIRGDIPRIPKPDFAQLSSDHKKETEEES
jgi:hypothetical protein